MAEGVIPAPAPGAGSPAVPRGCPAPQREETSLFPALVPALLSTTYGRGVRLPRHWRMPPAEGQPRRTGAWFSLSVARRGCTKRGFALPGARVPGTAAPLRQVLRGGLRPPSQLLAELLELLQSVLAAGLAAGAGTASVCFPGCVRGGLAAPAAPRLTQTLVQADKQALKRDSVFLSRPVNSPTDFNGSARSPALPPAPGCSPQRGDPSAPALRGDPGIVPSLPQAPRWPGRSGKGMVGLE